jgi:hypothetical protein
MDGLELTAPAPRNQNPDFDDTGSLWHRYRYLVKKPSLNVLLSSPSAADSRCFFKRNPTFDFGLHARANS